MSQRRSHTIAIAGILLMLSSACVVSSPEPAGSEKSGLPEDLGKRASVGHRDRPKKERSGENESSVEEPAETTSASDPASFSLVGSVADPSGDNGSERARYVDIVGVTIEDDGTRAQVAVGMAEAIPVQLQPDEVAGVGVDLFRGSKEYQLFASGEPGGWFGYLYGPKGFTQYEGDFAVADTFFVFTVPWEAIGGRGEGKFSAFADWTRSGSTSFSEDFAPESGKSPFETS